MSRPPPHSIAFPEHPGAKGMHFPPYTELLQQVSMTSNSETATEISARPESGRRPSQSQVVNALPLPSPQDDRSKITSVNSNPSPKNNSNAKTSNKLRPSQLSAAESSSLMSSVTMMLPPTFGTPAHLLSTPSSNLTTVASLNSANTSSNPDAKPNVSKSPVLGEIMDDDDGQSVVSDDFEEAPASTKRVKTARTNSQSQAKGSTTNNAKEKDKEKRKRQVQSCSECRRRKIKCDKKFPCGPCVLRNDQSICREVEKHNSSS